MDLADNVPTTSLGATIPTSVTVIGEAILLANGVHHYSLHFTARDGI